MLTIVAGALGRWGSAAISWLDDHVRAFAHFGGVPERSVYDRFSAAVKRRVGVLPLTERFRVLASHNLFEPPMLTMPPDHHLLRLSVSHWCS